MLVALDTNLIVYAEGVNGESMAIRAERLLRSLPAPRVVLPVQVLGELFNILVRKGRFSRGQARTVVRRWSLAYALIETSPSVLASALDLSVAYELRIWDAVILAAAANAGCRVLLSEDMQHGFTWSGVTVVNPFAPEPNPLLDLLFDDRQI